MSGVSLEAARASLAPNGKLRAGINYSNFLIVQRNAATGALSGIDRKSTRLNSSHTDISRMPSSA